MNPENYFSTFCRAQNLAQHLLCAHERDRWASMTIARAAEERAREELAGIAAAMGYELIQIKTPAEAHADAIARRRAEDRDTDDIVGSR